MSAAEHNRLTRRIVATLNSMPDCFAWKNETGASMRRGRTYFYGLKGSSDIVGLVDGFFFALEVKTGSGRQKSDQRHFEDRVNACGGLYGVVRSVDEALGLLHSWQQKMAV
ncbi:MAG: hypothetical protein HYW48_09255 [Deltaproteobacteria bacterium]|nr:hypothetical protein [Deltaproteobacteria bacterium]